MADAALLRSAGAPKRTPHQERAHDVSSAASGGRALPAGVRSALEPGFGRDFSSVRIHDAPPDRMLAQQLSARAFTHHGQIWLGDGQRADDLRLMAHELAHVVQQTDGTGRHDGVIQRQADDKSANTAGSVLPADPAAATTMQFKGIGEYGVAEIPVTSGSGPFRPMHAGPYILGPNSIQCLNGEYAPLYYVAYHLEKKRSEWIVGPESVEAFKAEADSRAQKAAGKPASAGRDADTPVIPLNRAHASLMKKTGIEPHYMARTVPYTSAATASKSIPAGSYDLIPHSVNVAQGGEEVLYYVARNKLNGYDQYIVGPDSVAEFQKNADAYLAGAGLAYMYGPPHGYEAESARFVWGGGSLGSAWSQASHDPKFLIQAAAAHLPVNRMVGPIARNIRGVTAAAMIGTAEAVPAVTLGAAPKAVIQLAEGATSQAMARQAVQPAVTVVAEAAPAAVTKAMVSAPAAAGGSATGQFIASGVKAATVTAAPALASRVDPAIDQAVERSFVEQNATTQPSAKAPLRRVQKSAEAAQAREDFGKVRGGYAQSLQVAAFGQVHHAIEVQVLSRYPGVYKPNEINQAANMRGVPPEVGGRTQLHNSKIREILDRHYRALDDAIASRGLTPGTPEYNALVRAWMDDAVAEIDYVVGQFFSEQRATLFLPD